MARDPRTPDCSVDGCTRAAHRLGLCRQHAPLVPREVSIELAAKCLRAQFTLRNEYHERARMIAEARLVETRSGSAAL